jgi:hypothetical protein
VQLSVTAFRLCAFASDLDTLHIKHQVKITPGVCKGACAYQLKTFENGGEKIKILNNDTKILFLYYFYITRHCLMLQSQINCSF